MKLNKEQQDILIKKLSQVWTNKICEICNKTDWMIDDTLFEIREFQGGTVLGSGAIKPLVTITCSSCGNTKLMPAIQLGIISTNQHLNQEGGQNE